MTPKTFDIAALRFKLHSQQAEPFKPGQRINLGPATILNQVDEMLNALAIYQEQEDLVVELPIPEAAEAQEKKPKYPARVSGGVDEKVVPEASEEVNTMTSTEYIAYQRKGLEGFMDKPDGDTEKTEA